MADVAVINASPLIFFSRANHIALLSHFAKTVLVPSPVAAEIDGKGPEDKAARAIRETPWIEVVPASVIPLPVLEWGLGPGESSVLAFALEHSGVEAIIDDLSARKCAATLGISVRGTLGIVLAAKHRQIIPSARVVMEDLIAAGLYLSNSVLNAALAKVDE
ncbi:MAG: DUF3368 domain-containing protein [Candidatus Hydrogenedentes bacterium]|nr:DUF3368 domain-containing protein [Candidatus Hydrogenedentota bacterium]